MGSARVSEGRSEAPPWRYRRPGAHARPRRSAPAPRPPTVLAELWLGLPLDTLPVIATAAGLLLLVLLATPAWAARGFPALLDWVLAEGADGSAAQSGARQSGADATPPPPSPARELRPRRAKGA
jgi:hypothetical protein